MGELGIIALIVGIVLALIGMYFTFTASRDRDTYMDALDEFEKEREAFQEEIQELRRKKGGSKGGSKSSSNKPAPAAAAAPAGSGDGRVVELETRLDEVKTQVKDLKQKSHESAQELKELRRKNKELRERKPAPEAMGNVAEMRMELVEAKGELETWKTRALEAEKTSKRRERAVEPVAAPVVAAPEVTTNDEGGISAEELDRLRSEYQTRQRKLERDKKELESELRGKLKRGGINLDRERRRADNNDKAYRITQRELDAARDRLRLLEEELNKARYAQSVPTAAPHGDPITEAAEEIAEATPAVETAPEAAVPVEPVTQEEAPAVEEVASAPKAQAEEAPVVEEAPQTEETPEAEEAPVEVAEAPEDVAEAAEDVAQAAPETPTEDLAVQDAPEQPVHGDPILEAAEDVTSSSEETQEVDEDELTKDAGEALGENMAIDDAWSEFDIDDV